MASQWRRDVYVIDTDNNRLNQEFIYRFLSQDSYWAQSRTFEMVQRSLVHSLNFGVFKDEEQIGFARVVTDYATFAWLADVFIIEDHRGKGLGKWLIEVVTAHPELQGLRRWILATRDAHDLYRQFGFTAPLQPDRLMEKRDVSQS
jgi:GNAT superfamily N-acetyltransferase